MPPIIFGTSCLGNLYRVVDDRTKQAIVAAIVRHSPAPVVLDSAGKYGAGLALEVMGRVLAGLPVAPADVVISNKLGWYRVPLRGSEPTFEPGVWAGLQHDAESRISYDGIRQCYEQGCALLGPKYPPQLVSVHDPDEFLAAARNPEERRRRFDEVLGAYRALFELKTAGRVRAVGVGSKDWRVIREIADRVDLDWVMLACSLTVYTHPPELRAFVAHLHSRGVGIINSAVFHSGFLTGGDWFDYRKPDPAANAGLFAWREKFFEICRRHEVKPAHVCVQFGLRIPGVTAVALNTEKPEKIPENAASADRPLPPSLWADLEAQGIISPGLG